VEEAVRSLAGQFATLRTQDGRRLDSVADYAHVQECRAEYLRRYFGEEHGEPCGLCDVCRGRPERPSTFFQPVAAPPRKGQKRHRALLRGLAGVHKKPPPSKQQEGSGDGNRRRRRRRRKRKGGGPEGARPAEAGAPTTSSTPASPPAGS
jgi:hypothetical protein